MSKNESISVTEWKQSFIRTVVLETVRLLRREEESLGPNYTGQLVLSFLASYVGALAFEPLNRPSGPNMESYGRVKALIENAIGAGFTGAHTQALGHEIEHYCQIKVVPQPLTNKVC